MHTTIDLRQAQNKNGAAMHFKYGPESKPLDGYTIKRAIQRGGFGEVYYALSDAGKEVALKLLQDNLDIELRGVSQCLNLKHPNLLTIFDVRRSSAGEHWIVMEYMTGETLDQAIAEHPTGMPHDQIAKLLSEIAAGVAHLHDQGLVHRDLKPANIYLENGGVKVGDVGLSKFISVSHRSAHTQSVGTVYYMAPEIAHGRYGREVDVYALGVILYEMVTGKVPFDGETTGEILMKQLTQPPDLSVIPLALRPVLARALEKDPLRRTPTAIQLAAEFQAAVGGKPTGSTAVQPHPPGPHSVAVQVVDAVHRSEPQRSYRPGEQPWQASAFPVALAVVTVVLAFMLLIMMLRGGVIRSWIGLGALAVAAFGIASAVRYGRSSRHPVGGAGARHSLAQRLNPRYVRYHGPEAPRMLSFSQRGAEASGSMAVACLCAALITGVLWAIGTFIATPPAAVLFASVTAMGAWAALVPAKIWEGRGGDGMARRLTTGLLGLGVGLAAYVIDRSLMVGIDMQGNFGYSLAPRLPLSAPESARIVGYSVFFGTLMLVRRWWYHVDAFRDHRVRLTSVFWTTAASFLISVIGGFPTEWAVMWGMATSVTAQLASAWVSPRQRLAQHEAQHA